MRILMVNKFLYPNGGSESYMFRIGRHLQRLGHEVEYFGMEHELRCVSNRADAYTRNMDFHNGSVWTKLSYPVRTIYSVESRKKIRLVLDDFKPDVVHMNNFTYQITPTVILEIKKWSRETNHRCRIVFTAHDYNLICPNHMLNNPNTGENCEKCLGGHFFHCIAGKCIHGSFIKSVIGAAEGYFWNYQGVYQYIDLIICCSGFMKRKMDSNRIFKEKTVMLHNFIETKAEDQWRKDIQDNRKKGDYVLYFGRFSKEKGIGTLLDVCRELPHISFVFAGSGPLEDQIAGITNITNVGFLKGEALEHLIQGARFSVYPSEWYENCPFSVMESQMYGTPVLGADIGGIPELIDIGKTGEVFESGNKEELKHKILAWWKDRSITDTYRENCRYIRFDTLEEYGDKLLKLYQEN